ncbi:MAG TPA: SDR family oxidoreductase [Methylocella sp.]|nr:SDR family oxidoreductase [Methylocella sp.]
MHSFRGKVALVVGGTSDIGRATAAAFMRAGAYVAFIGNRAPLDLADQASGQSVFIAADITREVEVRAAIDLVVSSYGSINFAANRVSVGPTADLIDYTEAEFDEIFQANLKGLFFCLKHQIRSMRETGGVIVNVTSVAARTPFAGCSLFNASKAAAAMLTHSAAVEAGKYGIRVIEVAPGPIETAMSRLYRKETGGSLDTSRDIIEASTLLGRMGRPEEVADAITFLCSPAASFVTATSLRVDGGFSLG